MAGEIKTEASITDSFADGALEKANIRSRSEPYEDVTTVKTEVKEETFEDIIVMKTEVQEELYDSEMMQNVTELLDMQKAVKPEYVWLPDNEPKTIDENELVIDNSDLENFIFKKENSDVDKYKCDIRSLTQEKWNNFANRFNSHYGNKELSQVRNRDDGDEKQPLTFNNIQPKDKPYKCTYKKCKCTELYPLTERKSCECTTCDYATALESDLNGHILSQHSDEREKYECSDNEDSTYGEKKNPKFKCKTTRYSNSRKTHKCGACTYFTYRKGNLMRHQLTHSDEKPLKCNTCEYATNQRSDLRYHKLTKHSTEKKKYRCSHCEYSTHIKHSFTTHSHTHADEKPFQCDICDYATIRKHILRYHMLTKHSNEEKKYQCSDCDYSTHLKENLAHHSLFHLDVKVFKCDLCEYAAVQKRYLKHHMLIKHSDKQEEVGKKEDVIDDTGIRVNNNQSNHVVPKEKQRKFKCDFCEYSTPYNCTLNNHVLVRHNVGDKKYKCGYCTYSTPVKVSLDRHAQIHTNNKQFKCNMCQFATIYKRSLKYHILVKHSEKKL